MLRASSPSRKSEKQKNHSAVSCLPLDRETVAWGCRGGVFRMPAPFFSNVSVTNSCQVRRLALHLLPKAH